MKKILIIVGATLAVLLIAVLVVPSFFNWNSQKQRIETAAQEALGQPVSIKGDISLALLPSPRLKAEGLSVGTRETLADGPYVSAGLIDVRVAFLPLLSGTIEASRVVLGDADIVVLTGQDTPPEQAQDAEPSTDAQIALPAVEIKNAKITLIDAATQEETSISQIDLSISAKSTAGPFSIEGGLRYNKVPLTLSVQTGNINAADFPIEARLESKGSAGFIATLAASGSDLAGGNPRGEGRLTLKASDLGKTIEAFTGAPNPSMNGQAVALATPFNYANQTLAADGLKITFGAMQLDAAVIADIGAQPKVIKLNLTADKLDLTPYLAEPQPDYPLMEAIELSLPMDMTADIQASAAQVLGFPTSIERVTLSARLSNGRLELKDFEALLPGGVTATGSGSFQTPKDILTGKVRAKLKGANAQTFLKSVLGPDAALPPAPTPIDIDLDASLEQEDARITAIVGRLGSMQINGSGKVGYGQNPVVDVTAKLSEITIQDWVSDGTAAPAAKQPATPPFKGTVRFDVGIDTVRSAGQTFEGLTAKGSLKDDVVAIQSLTLGTQKAAFVDVAGRIVGATSDKQQLDLQFKASAPNANQLLALGGLEPIDLAKDAGALSLSGTVKGLGTAPKVEGKGTLGGLNILAAADITGLDTDALQTKGTATLTHENIAAYLAKLGMLDASSVSKQAQPTTATATFDMTEKRSIFAISLDNASGKARLNASNEGEVYTATLNMTAPSLTEYVRSFGMAFDPAGARLGGLNVAMDVRGPLEALKLQTLQADIGPAKLTGSGTVNAAGDVTIVNLALAGKNLDLAEILPEAETGAQQAAGGQGERWSKEPLDLAALESLDGRVTLDLDRLTLQDYELKNARMSFTSEGRRMRIALENGILFEGPASLAIALDGTSTPKLDVDVAVKNGDIARATQSSAAIEPLTGTFDLQGTFNGVGTSEYDIVKSLNGSASFSARDGVINGVDIVQVNKRFGSLNTINDFLRVIGSALRGGQTTYRLIAVDAVAKDGILRTQNMRTDIDGGAKASLDSTINLPAWNIAAKGAFSLEDHPDAPPVGVAINGALDSPTIVYETKRLQEYVGVRLGAAVLKGVVKGEGFGLKDLLSGGKQPETETPPASTTPDQADPNQAAPSQQAPEAQPEPQRPEEQIRDLILKGLFGKKNKTP